MTDLPSYRELPEVDGGARSAWHLFGEDDDLGLVNLITAERSAAAAGLVRRGAVFPLDIRSDFLTPPLFGRGADRRTTLVLRGGAALDDVHDNFYPQSGSQWDSLAHVSFAPGRYYNGRTVPEIDGGALTIDHWAARGIVTRAVVLDVSSVVADRGGPGAAVALTPDDLEAVRRVEVTPGDVLLLHTGFLSWYSSQDAAARTALSNRDLLRAPGVEHTEAMAEYLWNLHIAGIAGDNPSVEVWPPAPDWPFGFLHQILIGQFGMALGELWWLADLVADCHLDGRWEAMLSSTPMNALGGIGSPANALAIK